MTTRATDVSDSLGFAESLRKSTGSLVSVNFSNVSNISDSDLEEFSIAASAAGIDFVYFADSHGTLDLSKRGESFANAVDLLRTPELCPVSTYTITRAEH